MPKDVLKVSTFVENKTELAVHSYAAVKAEFIAMLRMLSKVMQCWKC